MPKQKAPLSETHPELAAQALGWDPAMIAAGAAKVVDWKCNQGHEWKDSVAHRTSGRGCPYCGNKRVLRGFNDLATTHPEIAAQADGWNAETLTWGSGKVVSWKCSSGHRWDASVASRTSRGNGCPICSNKKVSAGINDLATTHPELASQAHGWDPETIVAGSHKKVDWRCEHGHTWKTAVRERVQGTNCPVCSNKKVVAGVNDLATTNPDLAAQIEGWDSASVVKFSHKKVDWRCEYGHTWKATIASRSSGSGCPICSGHQVLTGHNDLATTNPDLGKQLSSADPQTLTAGSSQKVTWKCELGHTWKATVARRSGGSGCPICSGSQVLAGFNDVATTHPELATQAHGWDPTAISAGSSKKMRWKCPKGHVWHAALNSRAGNGRGCPVCANKAVQTGYNDLATTHPELAKQADGWNPSTVIAGSHKRAKWRCEIGHSWTAVVGNRAAGLGCPYCAGKRVLRGFNDLATTHPELAAQAHGWDPETLTAGSSTKKVQWRCDKGHIWKALVRDRSRGVGCPSCASAGFDPNQVGWLYFIDNDDLKMFQVGISNIPERRLKEHSKRGWEVIEIRGPMDGHLAQHLETAILRAIARRGAVLGHKAEIQKFDGYSEAWTKESLWVDSLRQLMDWVYEDDQNA